MKFFWIIPFFLLQDTEAFLIKNARVKLCLQASLINRILLLEDCNPESDFQDWSWQGDFAEAEHKYLPATLATTHVHKHTADNATLPLGLELQQLEELLWFFRREDPSTWNYSVLALSLVTMILGLVLLTINIVRNRKRKILMNREAAQTTQEADLDAKQALMPVQEYSLAKPQKQEPVPQDQRPGDVVVQWKDGTVTSLYTEMSEESI